MLKVFNNSISFLVVSIDSKVYNILMNPIRHLTTTHLQWKQLDNWISDECF